MHCLFFSVLDAICKDLKAFNKGLVLDHLSSVLVDKPESKDKGHTSIEIVIQYPSVIEKLIGISFKPGRFTLDLFSQSYVSSVYSHPLIKALL